MAIPQPGALAPLAARERMRPLLPGRLVEGGSVLIRTTDYNGAGQVIAADCAGEWAEVEAVLTAMPLHLKASDQAKIQGRPIFDPVGTNEYIRNNLRAAHWRYAIPIPAEYEFLGTEVDFAKGAMVVEAQFSNYPFLLNNTIRSELFFQAGLTFGSAPSKVTVILTKAQMFPASNSTLYYEQATSQLDALARNSVFRSPIRLVGLFVDLDTLIQVTWSTYTAARYSRTVAQRQTRECVVGAGRTPTSRARIQFIT